MSLEDFLNSYGYAAVLAGTFLEGETILILAGIAAKMGYLDLRWVILMGVWALSPETSFISIWDGATAGTC